MIQNIKPYMEHVKGNTYCIITGYCRFPLYKYTDTEAILLDSGLPYDWEGILECIENAGLRITAALTSHGHPDHLGNHLNLRKHFGTRIYMSLYAAAVYADPMNQVACTMGMSSYQKMCKYVGKGIQPDEWIDPKAPTVTVEGVPFGVLYTPGHNAEHMCFVTPDNVAYLADAILSEHIARAIRTPFCTCPELDLASKEMLMDTRYDCYILAHNGTVTDIRALAQLNRDLLLEKIQMVAAFCDHYITLEELSIRVMEATHNEMDSARKVLGTQRNVTAFLAYLMDQKQVVVRANGGRVEFIRTELQ